LVKPLVQSGHDIVSLHPKTMYKIRSHCRISQEDLVYLQNLGRKI